MRRKFEIFPERFGYFPYMWLIYMVLPIAYAFNHYGWKRIICFGLITLTIITYRQLYSTSSKSSFYYWLGLQMLLIITLSIFFDINNLFMGFYTANFVGYIKHKKYFNISMAALVVTEVLPLIINMHEIPLNNYLFLLPFVMVMFVTPFTIRSINKRHQLETELDQANKKIKELITSEERARISRDLHDTLGHTLSLITLKSQLVQKLADTHPDKARREAEEIEHTSRTALRQVRELVTDMRTVTLSGVLREVQEILRSANISLQHADDSRLLGIPDPVQNVLSMCLKEAITNVVKHSQATSCSIQIDQTKNEVKLIISDNGIGCSRANSNGNGLKGMIERLASVEGNLALSPPVGGGTQLLISIPFTDIKGKECETA